MEMRCYHKKLHISYKDRVTNEEIHAKIQQASGPHQDLVTIVKRHKLQWYSQFSCSSGLAKTILQGTVKGGRRQGRRRKRWEDNISEWTGLEFSRSQRAVENRKKWRKLVAKSCGAPATFVVKGYMMMMMSVYSRVSHCLSVWACQKLKHWDLLRCINFRNVKFCVVLLFIEFYLFIPFSLIVTIFQGHSNVKKLLKILCSSPVKLRLCRIVR